MEDSEDCASSVPETNVINFSNILLHAANHSLAENEADDFIVPIMLLERTNNLLKLSATITQAASKAALWWAGRG